MANTRRKNRSTRVMHGGTPITERQKHRLVPYLNEELTLITDALVILKEVFNDNKSKYFYEKRGLTDLKGRYETIFNDLKKIQDEVQEKLTKLKRDLNITTNNPSNLMPNNSTRTMNGGTLLNILTLTEEQKRKLHIYLDKQLKLIKEAIHILVGVFEDRPHSFYAKFHLTDLKDRNESVFNDLEKVQDEVEKMIDKIKENLEYTSNDPSNV